MIPKGFWDSLPRPIYGLSPMDGVTDGAFRYITAKYGRPHVVYTEFVCVDAFHASAIKVLDDFVYDEVERPVVAQVFGADPKLFYETAILICELGFDGMDINMGCPSKNVTKISGGGALIEHPGLAREIVEASREGVEAWVGGKSLEDLSYHGEFLDEILRRRKVSSVIASTRSNPVSLPSEKEPSDGSPTQPLDSSSIGVEDRLLEDDGPLLRNDIKIRKPIPVSLKTRIGFSKIVTEEWFTEIRDWKMPTVAIHGRTVKQMYDGFSNWEEIRKAADILHESGTIVLGNGDLTSLAQGKQQAEEYHVDGFLIGRKAIGNPWIFHEDSTVPTLDEVLAILLEHATKYVEYFGEKKHFAFLKKHFVSYIKGFPHAKDAREQLMGVTTLAEVQEIVKDIKDLS